jgi:hypothetical protein
MKIGGVEVKGPNVEVLVLPRLDGDIVIKARAVTDMSEFEALVPEPKAPGRLTKNGWEPQLNDETYKQRVAKYNEQRFAYMVLQSLEPSEIEWEDVQMDNPKTWANWEKELRAAGLSDVEVNRITVCVMQANALDERKLREAREVFLRGMAEGQNESSGHPTEPENTPSGDPASDSESDPQE